MESKPNDLLSYATLGALMDSPTPAKRKSPINEEDGAVMDFRYTRKMIEDLDKMLS